jgi:hypothetical protein
VGGQTAEIRPISHSGEDTHHKIQFMLSHTVVDHYKSNALCYKANRSELRELLSFITCLATLPTWPLRNYNRIRWVFSTNYDWRLDRMLRHPCKPKLIQFDPIAVRQCRLSGVVGSRTRGFVNSRQPSTACNGPVLPQFMPDSKGLVRVLLSGAPATTWALK